MTQERLKQAREWVLGLKPWQQAALGVLALLLIVSLLGGDTEPEAGPAFPIKLKVQQVEAEPHRREIVMYGSTQPVRDVPISAQTQGQVVAIPAKEGQYLKKGDVILRIDARERPERLAEAKALLAQREIEYEAARKLQSRGFQSKIALAQAKAQLEQARTSLKQVELDAGFANLTAPFDGRLEEVNREVGDFAGIGTFGVEGAAARIVDTDPLLVVGALAELDRSEVSIGQKARARLADGRMVEGWVSHLANVANGQSRTFRIEMEVPNPDDTLPAGITAELRVPGAQRAAYLVSASVLGLDDDGRVGIKRLDEANTVIFEPIEIIEETTDGLWVAGLPNAMRLITVGHAYVSAGQEIPAEAIAEQE